MMDLSHSIYTEVIARCSGQFLAETNLVYYDFYSLVTTFLNALG